VLTALMVELLTPRQLSAGEFSMDIMPGTDEPGFSGVMPALERDVSTSYEAAEHPVKIASVEFFPKELITLFGWLRRPTKESIEGWLECKTDEATVSANYTCRRPFRGSERKHWFVRHAGPQSREEVLSLLAAQIVVDLRKVDFTGNGRSYRALRAALRTSILDQETSDKGSTTRGQIETALSWDPRNWIARFSLALELCKGGSPGEAIKHFEMLESLLAKVVTFQTHASGTQHELAPGGGPVCQEDSDAFAALYEHLRRYLSCPYLIRYNKAIALAACGEALASENAHQILKELATLEVPAGTSSSAHHQDGITLTRRAAAELRLNALSARANMVATEAWRRGEFTPQDFEEVTRLIAAVDGLCLAEQDQHWRSFQTARAVAHSAHGRALLAKKDGAGAIAALRSALAAQPTFAAARMQIAEVYMALQKEIGSDWALQAKQELFLALGISSNCKQIQSSLAALYSSEAVGQVREARRIYGGLGELPASALWLGQFILNTQARECRALFAVHQYLSICASVVPSRRQQLEESVADFISPSLHCLMTGDFLKLIDAAQQLLEGLEAADMAFPPGLLVAARQQLSRVGGIRKASI